MGRDNSRKEWALSIVNKIEKKQCHQMECSIQRKILNGFFFLALLYGLSKVVKATCSKIHGLRQIVLFHLDRDLFWKRLSELLWI